MKKMVLISLLILSIIAITGCTKDSPPEDQISGSHIIDTEPAAQEDTFTNSIGMEFVMIPAGDFSMGSPSGEDGRIVNEGPTHQVFISKPFYMGKYEVTQGQWREIMGINPSWFKGDTLPTESVSWKYTQEFVTKLNQREKTDKYRLPTEAEWEYAARAGIATRYSFGDDDSGLDEYGWCGLKTQQTYTVGQKLPNPWGLYDMHGNVWEWVQDEWIDNYGSTPTDGSAYEIGNTYHVSRGGSWGNAANLCRSATRSKNGPGIRDFHTGFRMVRDM